MHQTVLFAIYATLTTIAAPFAAGVLAIRPRGRARLRERFGFWGVSRGAYVWFHGASAGELKGMGPVLAEWRRRFPDDRILVTATTVTGLEVVGAMADEVRLLPFDGWPFIKRALRGLRISLFVATETEIWPSLLSFLSGRDVPCCLVNGRISQRSFPHYWRVRDVVGPALLRFGWIGCGDRDSYARFRALASGSSSAIPGLDQIEMAGNTKFDVARPIAPGRGDPFWDGYRDDSRPTIVLGCIRPSEEDWWFAAIARHLSASDAGQPRLRVVVAPRHREKFGYFAERLEAAQLPFQLRSSGTYDRSRPVVVLDQFGELAQAYEGASVSFIGATLIPLGGHNPLEAAAWGSYVVVGPSFDTYQPLIEELVQRGAGAVIHSADDIERIVGEVISAPDAIRTRGQEGLVVWQSQQGATARVIEQLVAFRGRIS